MIKFDKSSKYRVFSNFEPCTIRYGGLIYPSVEAAFQAQKTLDENERLEFTRLTASQAKKKGRTLKLRDDWEDVKVQVMYDLCLEKFRYESELKDLLLETGDEEIVENTTAWHDNIWGNCDCLKCSGIIGQNLLGKVLMRVRDDIK